ncbi:MAG: hypothetical protein QOH51_2474 [Acidobacteriota bacterium]|nr:hypothetical protein [Acidobacteriota bacterium]
MWQKTKPRRQYRVGAPLRGLAPRQRQFVNSNESVTSTARERQGFGIREQRQDKILVEIATESATRAAKSVRRTFTPKPYRAHAVPLSLSDDESDKARCGLRRVRRRSKKIKVGRATLRVARPTSRAATLRGNSGGITAECNRRKQQKSYRRIKSSLPVASASEAEDRVELQTRERAIERAGRRLAEGAQQPRGASGKDARQRERHARVGGVSDDEAMHAHVG